MPGWYYDAGDESIHTGDDMKVSDRALNWLKAQVEGLIEPEAVRPVSGSDSMSSRRMLAA